MLKENVRNPAYCNRMNNTIVGHINKLNRAKGKIKSDTVFPSISHEIMGPYAMILVF
jgi:hypothetical protein